MNKEFDIICLGRAGVDIYADQIGARLEDVQSFSKYIGGSSCNIAYGCARLGLKSSMLTRVGNEHMGRFITETLRKGGVDVSHIKVDRKRLSGLVILGIKSQEVFPLIFYRQDCADMALSEADIEETYLQKSRSLLITGTHLSTEKTSLACRKALDLARANGLKTILDIDYRPVLWGLTDIDRGEDRFVASASVSQHLQSFIRDFDLIVGTEEEFQIVGGSDNIIDALKTIREHTDAVLVLKRGAQGNSVIEKGDALASSLEGISFFKGLKVKVLNVLGAGDAFLSGFLKGWLEGKDYETCSLYANACGALTVSRHGCSPAIPSWAELKYYLENREKIARIDRDENLNYLHKATNRIYHDYQSKEFIILDLSHLYVLLFGFLKREQPRNKAIKIDEFNEALISVLNQISQQSYQQGKYKNRLRKIGFSFPAEVPNQIYQDVIDELSGRQIFLARSVNASDKNTWSDPGSLKQIREIFTYPQEQIIKYNLRAASGNGLDQVGVLREIFLDCLKLNRSLLINLKGVNFSDAEERVRSIYQSQVKPDWWQFSFAPTTDADISERFNSERLKALEKLVHSHDPFLQGMVFTLDDEVLVNDDQIKSINKIFKMNQSKVGAVSIIEDDWGENWIRAAEIEFCCQASDIEEFFKSELKSEELKKQLKEKLFFSIENRISKILY